MTNVGYNGEIVQCVVTQKLATCIVYRHRYIDRSQDYLLIYCCRLWQLPEG